MPPSILIRLEFEAAPVVHVDALDDAEETRLVLWITSTHREYGDLVARALKLSRDRAA
jgi:hypothetical protein